MLKSNAHQKFETLNPSTRDDTAMMINALMTKRNSPMVIIVKGKVRKTNIGRITALMIPKIPAAITAVPKLVTVTPGSR